MIKPETVIAVYEIPGTEPITLIEVTSEGHVRLRPTMEAGDGIGRIPRPDMIRLGSLTELQQVIEQAIVDDHRAQLAHYPLPGLIREVLAEAPPEGFSTAMVRSRLGTQDYTHADVLRELRVMEREGTARRLTAQGIRWVLRSKQPDGHLEWHEGTHPWDTHDGYRRHQHSLNGALTIAPGDTRVHFAHGPDFG